MTDLRDKKHGRIYRVVYQGVPESPPMSLADATPEQLVETLRHSNLFWRRHAQRLLVERGDLSVVPSLVELVEQPRLDEIGLDVGAIHALWTLHGLNAIQPTNTAVVQAVVSALTHPSVGVRRNAIQVLPRSSQMLTHIFESGMLDHPSGQLRLMALLALAESPASAEGAEAIVAGLTDTNNLRDRWLLDGLVAAGSAQDEHFLRALRSVPADAMEQALSRHPEAIQRVVSTVVEHQARTGLAEVIVPWAESLADVPTTLAGSLLEAFQRGWPRDKPVKLEEETEEQLVEILQKLPAEARGQLISIAARWESPKLAEYAAGTIAELLEQASDEEQSDQTRLQAARQLVALSPTSPETVSDLLDLITPRTSPELSEGCCRRSRPVTLPKRGN
jgi:uncharacterized protein